MDLSHTGRTPGNFWPFVAVVVLAGKAWIGLDWIRFDVYNMDMDMDILAS